jgi:peroxiredoxin
MKNVRMALLVSALLIVGTAAACAQSSKNLKGQDPPPLTVSAWINSDKPISLADLKGQKVVLVEFFMVKCPHCVDSVPQLRRLHENYAENGFLLISVTNDPQDKVKAFLDEYNLKNVVAIDTNYKTMVTYGVEGVPWSFLIGASGKIIWQGDPRALDEIQLQSELMDLKPAEKKEAK